MKIPIYLLGLVFFIAFTFQSTDTHSQIKFGPKIGTNWSMLPNHTGYITGNQYVLGYHLGVVAEIRIIDQLFLESGISIITKSSKYIVGENSIGNNAGFSDFQYTSLNADLPLNLKYKFNLGNLKLFLLAGPQLGYGLSGQWKASNGTTSNVHYGNGPSNDLKAFDYGLNFGGGVEVGRIQFSSSYYQGLTTLSPLTPPLKEQKFKVISISMSYLFGKEKRNYRHYKNRYWSKYGQNSRHRKIH